MPTQISKWGNSLAIRIPKDVAAAAGLAEGDAVELSAQADGFSVRRSSLRPRYDLEKLMAGVTKDNLHGGIDWGEPKGGEVW